MTPLALRGIASRLSNIDKDQLVAAGVIRENAVGGSDWNRFNKDPLMFILKLPHDHLQALCNIINEAGN